MIVGIPKEIKNNEYRVSLTPAGAMELVRRGHTVYIQSGAGVDSGFADKEYQAVGAKLLPTIEEVYATAEMIIKVKEPIAPEYGLVRPRSSSSARAWSVRRRRARRPVRAPTSRSATSRCGGLPIWRT